MRYILFVSLCFACWRPALASGTVPQLSTPVPVVGASATYNVQQYGVKGTAHRVLDGAMQAGSNELESATANFALTDVGQPITVLGAEMGWTRIGLVAGAPLVTTIAAWVSPTTVRLAQSALVSVTGASVSWGPDDRKAIQALIEKVGDSGGGTLYFPCGTYGFSNTEPISVDHSNVRLTGAGSCSQLYNSYVRFDACRGANCPVPQNNSTQTYTNQIGISVLAISSTSLVTNVEVDHLSFQDNGQDYDYDVWGPNGPAVLGTSSAAPAELNDVYIHDNTVGTDYLVGIGTDSVSDSIYIYNNTILSSANHCIYAAGGPKTNVSIMGNTCRGTTYPMRGGIDYKEGDGVLIANNDISNVAQHGIGIDANTADQLTQNVAISGNNIHDLNPWTRGTAQPWNNHGIQLNSGTNVTIENNTITNINYSGIFIEGGPNDISGVTIENNVISQIGGRGIWVFGACSPAPCSSSTASNLTITGNKISSVPGMGIYLQGVGGKNYLSENVVQGNGTLPPNPQSCGVGYNLMPAPSSQTVFSGNTGLHCKSNNFVNVENLTSLLSTNSLKQ